MNSAALDERVCSHLSDALVDLDDAHIEQRRLERAHEVVRWTTLFEVQLEEYHLRLLREGQRGLTPRERDVVAQVLRGSSNKEIAYDLGIAHATVRVLLHRVMAKFGVQSREALLVRLRPPVANELGIAHQA